jgi:uridine phosphorylase
VTEYDAIVNPSIGKHTARIGPVAVMAACEPDMRKMAGLFEYSGAHKRSLFISDFYHDPDQPAKAALAGPFIGAPYAGMLLETLIVRGARRIVFLGWCGALSPDLKIGDLVVPTAAIVDEGTSAHYPPADSQTAPSPLIVAAVDEALANAETQARQALIWTTDAAFRETRERVTAYQRRGAVAVDMETSALFAVAAFRQVEIGAVLIVSDSLAGDRWQPGFKAPQFKSGRQAACQLVKHLCRKLHQQT